MNGIDATASAVRTLRTKHWTRSMSHARATLARVAAVAAMLDSVAKRGLLLISVGLGKKLRRNGVEVLQKSGLFACFDDGHHMRGHPTPWKLPTVRYSRSSVGVMQCSRSKPEQKVIFEVAPARVYLLKSCFQVKKA